MADQNKARFHDDSDPPDTLPVKGTDPKAEQAMPRLLPPWKVILHNDEVNEMEQVVETIHKLTTLKREQAVARMQEAHVAGTAVLLITHRERAELYVEQFRTCRLTVTIGPVA